MDDDWDLHAVVRGCTTTTTTSSSSSSSSSSTTTTATATEIPPPSSKFQPIDDHFLFFPDLFKPRNDAVFEDLHHLYKPFFPKSEYVLQQQQNQQIPISPLSVLGGVQDLSQQQLQQKQQQRTKHLQPKQSPSTTTTPTHSNHSLRSKRRKNQMKKVCHVPAEGLSSDMWSWRKYGQKPIKGSPYPRGYYRCSTSKGCLARKQVERNRSDPGMFIVTYTAEHNHPMPTHRNSLAGSTRQKPESTQTAKSGETNKPTCSPETEKVDGREEMEDTVEVEEEEDDLLFGVSDTVMGDDFFEGLDELADPATGEIFPDHFPATIQCAWLTNNVTTTAAGGG